MALRIIIADDHALCRHGLRSIIATRPDWELCAEAVNGREAVRETLRIKPDILVMDIGMPELNGLDATRQVLKDLPLTEVLILTMYDAEHVMQDVLESGARALVLKSDADRHLVSAIESLSRHKPYFTGDAAALLLAGYGKGEVPAEGETADRLTQREREIVQLVAEGKSNKDVADLLGISVRTVETHRAHILTKLNLKSTGDLVRYAVRNRIIHV